MTTESWTLDTEQWLHRCPLCDTLSTQKGACVRCVASGRSAEDLKRRLKEMGTSREGNGAA